MRIPAYISFLIFASLLALCAAHVPVFGDPDTAWHIAAGDFIRAHHTLPQHDSWSFTAASERWYNISWLFDIALSLLFQVAGFTALYLMTLLVCVGSLAAMAHYCIKYGANLLIVILLSPLILLVVYGGVLARPNLCSLVLTLGFYFLLQSYRQTGQSRILLVLPPLMALWANLHGGFLLAFPVMGIFVLDACSRHDRNAAYWLSSIFTLCLAATLVNPYGLALYYAAYKSLAGTFDQASLIEWQPVAVGKDIAMTLLLGIMLWCGNAGDTRISLADRLLAWFMLLLALSSFRHGAVASLLVMPYITLRLTFMAYDSRYADTWRRKNATLLTDMHKPDVAILAACMALVAVAVIALPVTRTLLLKAPLGFSKELYPETEARYVLDHYPGAQFFNDYNMGGYLDYLWRGKVKLFVDGRSSSLYSADVLEDYTQFQNAAGFGGRASMVAAEYKFDGLILLNSDKNSGDWAWNPAWKSVFHGPVATVYIRR